MLEDTFRNRHAVNVEKVADGIDWMVVVEQLAKLIVLDERRHIRQQHLQEVRELQNNHDCTKHKSWCDMTFEIEMCRFDKKMLTWDIRE